MNDENPPWTSAALYSSDIRADLLLATECWRAPAPDLRAVANRALERLSWTFVFKVLRVKHMEPSHDHIHRFQVGVVSEAIDWLKDQTAPTPDDLRVQLNRSTNRLCQAEYRHPEVSGDDRADDSRPSYWDSVESTAPLPEEIASSHEIAHRLLWVWDEAVAHLSRSHPRYGGAWKAFEARPEGRRPNKRAVRAIREALVWVLDREVNRLGRAHPDAELFDVLLRYFRGDEHKRGVTRWIQVLVDYLHEQEAAHEEVEAGAGPS